MPQENPNSSQDFSASDRTLVQEIPYIGDRLSRALDKLSDGNSIKPVCRLWGHFQKVSFKTKPGSENIKALLRLAQSNEEEVIVDFLVPKKSAELSLLNSFKPGDGITIVSLPEHTPRQEEGRITFKEAHVIPALPDKKIQPYLRPAEPFRR